MMIAHLPAGWLLVRGLLGERPGRSLWAAGLLGSIAPDLDMLLFLASGGQTHHHAYPTHFPLVWLAAIAASLLIDSRSAVMLSLSALLHQVLDSLVGDIAWLAPLDHRRWSWFAITDRYDPWWLNFVLHWTFLLEISLWALAMALSRTPPPAKNPTSRKSSFQ